MPYLTLQNIVMGCPTPLYILGDGMLYIPL